MCWYVCILIAKKSIRGTVESNGIKKQFGALGIQKKVLIVDGYFTGKAGRNLYYPDGWYLVSVYIAKTLHHPHLPPLLMAL